MRNRHIFYLHRRFSILMLIDHEILEFDVFFAILTQTKWLKKRDIEGIWKKNMISKWICRLYVFNGTLPHNLFGCVIRASSNIKITEQQALCKQTTHGIEKGIREKNPLLLCLLRCNRVDTFYSLKQLIVTEIL